MGSGQEAGGALGSVRSPSVGNVALTGSAATQEARGTRDEAQATGGAQLASSKVCGESGRTVALQVVPVSPGCPRAAVRSLSGRRSWGVSPLLGQRWSF